ncbi:MAG: hypothetical protein R3Y28_05710 [Candidatus Gastranaerophilales bacterium]
MSQIIPNVKGFNQSKGLFLGGKGKIVGTVGSRMSENATSGKRVVQSQFNGPDFNTNRIATTHADGSKVVSKYTSLNSGTDMYYTVKDMKPKDNGVEITTTTRDYVRNTVDTVTNFFAKK